MNSIKFAIFFLSITIIPLKAEPPLHNIKKKIDTTEQNSATTNISLHEKKIVLACLAYAYSIIKEKSNSEKNRMELLIKNPQVKEILKICVTNCPSQETVETLAVKQVIATYIQSLIKNEPIMNHRWLDYEFTIETLADTSSAEKNLDYNPLFTFDTKNGTNGDIIYNQYPKIVEILLPILKRDKKIITKIDDTLVIFTVSKKQP